MLQGAARLAAIVRLLIAWLGIALTPFRAPNLFHCNFTNPTFACGKSHYINGLLRDDDNSIVSGAISAMIAVDAVKITLGIRSNAAVRDCRGRRSLDGG